MQDLALVDGQTTDGKLINAHKNSKHR